MSKKKTPQLRLNRRMLAGVSAAALIAPILAAGGAHAVSISNGELTGSFDTTLTVGALFRVQGQAQDLVGRSVLTDRGVIGATGLDNNDALYSFNGDDGNLNYGKGLASLVGRATHELRLNYRDYGAFIRGTYFYDVVNAEKSSDDFGRTGYADLPDASIERIGRDFDLLDAFVYGTFGPVDIRLGNQVLSWGESTFIPNGINTINPVDVSALRAPGAELREGFVPVPIADVNVMLSDQLSFEAFYQFKWKETEPEAYGSMFSTSDAGSPGGRGLLLSFSNPNADIPGFTDSLDVAQVTPINPLGARILRTEDDEPSDQGQFGFALRYFAPELRDSEIGLYFMNYHSRLPVLEYQLPTQAEFLQGLASAGQAAVLGQRLQAGDPTAAAALGAFYASQTNPNFRAINDFTTFNLKYTEDIQLFGASINTSLPGGISLGAEYSFRKDQPLAFDDTEVAQTVASAILGTQLTNALTTAGAQPVIRAQLQALVNAGQITAAAADAQAATMAAQMGLAAARANVDLYDNYGVVRRLGINPDDPLGSTGALLGQTIRGYDFFDVSQAQATLTKAFGPLAGSNQWVLVGEVGGQWIHNYPDDIRLDGPGTDLTYVPAIAGQGGAPPDLFLDDGFATEFSWGYRAIARFDYLNAYPGVNLFPTVSFQHDVQGTSPSPIGNFVEDRMALGLNLRAVIRETWTAELGYTTFFGAGKRNLIRDRDFVSLNVKYFF